MVSILWQLVDTMLVIAVDTMAVGAYYSSWLTLLNLMDTMTAIDHNGLHWTLWLPLETIAVGGYYCCRCRKLSMWRILLLIDAMAFSDCHF